MGTIARPFGESIWFADGTTPQSNATISANEGSNLAALMDNRERFDYVWADAAARGAQTGMTQGSRGYQIDTKTEYIYDPTWRGATPYIEFSAPDVAIAAATYTALTGWSVDDTRSSDSTIVTTSGNALTFLRAGLYLLSMTSGFLSVGTNVFQNFTEDGTNPPTQFIANGGYAGGVSTISTPYRVLTDNTVIYVWAYNSTASTLTKRRIRIMRIG